MCGIAGFLKEGGFHLAAGRAALDAQTRTLMHRGPDDQGAWLDEAAGIALGHRRLSILDLSPAGHQPMPSASGRYVVILNGEIYNHAQIRARLIGAQSAAQWRGHSDTETLLAAFDAWGVEFTLTEAVGMFALAVWDRQEHALILARDRLGEKPLYFGWQGRCFLFGSELKALRAHTDFRAEIDRESVMAYVRDGYIRAPRSIYRNIFKLMPGTLLRLPSNIRPGDVPAAQRYWSLDQAMDAGRREPFRGSEEEAADALQELLGRAVALQSIADVPLGAFLSGGIDSSLVVAVMQSQSRNSVKTFSIGFNESRFNEAHHAKAVAHHLGTDHTELYVDSDIAMRVIPKLAVMFDEPFGDSSAIPSYLVAELARSKVTVSLSGDGGDELFGGYSRYQRTAQIWKDLQRIPSALRSSVSNAARAVELLTRATSIGPVTQRAAQYLSARSAEECYAMQTSHDYGLPTRVLGEFPQPARVSAAGMAAANESIFELMMSEDTLAYLPDDILVKVDRSSMAVGLEARVPLLDHRVVEFAWRLPLAMKVRGSEGKWLLKKVLRRHVPGSLIDRPKMGFGVPVGEWLRGPLRAWAEDLLSEDRLGRQGIFDPVSVRGRWQRYLKGGRVSSDGVWQLLMFQSWLDG